MTGKPIAVSSAAVPYLSRHLRDLDKLEAASLSFREFLNYWHFRDQDTGAIRVLGECLWPAQEEFVCTAETHSWIFYLKARQLGESTIGCAFDGWVGRFRDANGRVHIYSKREDSAQELLANVRFGLENLPEWWRLGVARETVNEYVLDAGENDRRMWKAYPADKNTSRGATCSHAHIDEWAFMGDPRAVWQSIEPSAAGSVHFITTGMGPANYTSGYWRRCLAGDAQDRRGNPVYPSFIGALNRPDRTEAWLKGKRAGMDETAFLQEYPQKWEDALSGGGEYKFTSAECDAAGVDFRSLGPSEAGHKYSIGVDIGRHKDAAVITVLDVTEDVHDVRYYERLRGISFPEIQRAIERVRATYGRNMGVEANGVGEAVLENLSIPEWEVKDAKFTTSKPSKARIIEQLKVAMQNQTLKWDPAACAQLDSEMRGYQIPDDNVVQDSVISLAIALEYAPQAYAGGRLRSVGSWG